MNSAKTNLKLIENITVQVPNTTSISKDILFNVSKFLEKMVFQLMFEIIRWSRQHQVRPQTGLFQNFIDKKMLFNFVQ